MKKLFITALFFCATVLLYAQAGMKLRMTTLVDGENREYFLHIPSSYDGKTDVPLVFMLHGTGGDGEKMYDIAQKFGIKLHKLYRKNRMQEGQEPTTGQVIYLQNRKPRS